MARGLRGVREEECGWGAGRRRRSWAGCRRARAGAALHPCAGDRGGVGQAGHHRRPSSLPPFQQGPTSLVKTPSLAPASLLLLPPTRPRSPAHVFFGGPRRPGGRQSPARQPGRSGQLLDPVVPFAERPISRPPGLPRLGPGQQGRQRRLAIRPAHPAPPAGVVRPWRRGRPPCRRRRSVPRRARRRRWPPSYRQPDALCPRRPARRRRRRRQRPHHPAAAPDRLVDAAVPHPRLPRLRHRPQTQVSDQVGAPSRLTSLLRPGCPRDPLSPPVGRSEHEADELLLAPPLFATRLGDDGGPVDLSVGDGVWGEGGVDGVESRWLEQQDDDVRRGYQRAKGAAPSRSCLYPRRRDPCEGPSLIDRAPPSPSPSRLAAAPPAVVGPVRHHAVAIPDDPGEGRLGLVV